jgi:hypothetical protein
MAGYGVVDVLNSDTSLRPGIAVTEGRIVSDSLVRENAIDHHPFQSILTLHKEVR